MFDWFLNVLINNKAISRTSDNFTCCHTRDRAGRPSASACHIILKSTQRGHSGDRIQDPLTRSRALYRLSNRAPLILGHACYFFVGLFLCSINSCVQFSSQTSKLYICFQDDIDFQTILDANWPSTSKVARFRPQFQPCNEVTI